MKKKYLIYPDNYYKFRWNIFIAFLLIISVIATPLDLAFSNLMESNAGYTIFVYIIDVFFFIDLILTFFSAYESDSLDIQDDHKTIILNYL